jgi:hypothetical protein
LPRYRRNVGCVVAPGRRAIPAGGVVVVRFAGYVFATGVVRVGLALRVETFAGRCCTGALANEGVAVPRWLE